MGWALLLGVMVGAIMASIWWLKVTDAMQAHIDRIEVSGQSEALKPHDVIRLGRVFAQRTPGTVPDALAHEVGLQVIEAVDEAGLALKVPKRGARSVH